MRAPLAALQFTDPDCGLLSQLSAEDWTRTLRFCDRTQLTLPLAIRGHAQAPHEVRVRFDRNLCGNATRWRRVQAAYREIAEPLEQEGSEFVVLKGFSHCPHFVADPRLRPQYDFDLLLPEAQLLHATQVARTLGYVPLREPTGRTDHLPTMIRKTGWEWTGDLYDPEIPLGLELHFRLWDEQTELFAPAGLDQFWERRERRELEGLSFTAFHPVDQMAYASLHLLRHLLRGDVKPFHVYELASLLHATAADDSFWARWMEWHEPSLRTLEAICFSIAHRWFHCGLSPAAAEEIERLPPDVARWMELFAFSPLSGLARSNKDELWLHWSLTSSSRGRGSMMRRRLLPAALPGPVDAVHLPDSKLTPRIRLRRKLRFAHYSAQRVLHHLVALPSVATGAARWFIDLPGRYWTFFLTAALFNFGLFVFYFLYNLYLMKLGFHENFLGMISGVMTAGSIAGCIPAAASIRRFGMRRTLFVAFLAIAILSALRAIAIFPATLVELAFLGGFAGSVWGVAISPSIADLTTERNRSLGFSLFFASGVGIGVLGGFAGGHLPAAFLHLFASDVAAYRASLLCGLAFVLMALWPLSRLRINAAPQNAPIFTRPSPMLLQFFAALVVWNLGTGAFNPFFSAFFVHLKMPAERIGGIFSGAHFMQAIGMLCAPLAIRRLGLTRAVSAMQLVTALSLAALAFFPAAAVLAYGGYTVSQYMSEPGMFAMLMNSVPAARRAGTSALNMIVILGSQAAAAGLSGVLITHAGYPPVLAAAALICATAAILFHGLRTAPSDS